MLEGFPGGLVVKNPPVNAGDTGSIPALERFHMLLNSRAPEPQLLSPCSRVRKLQLPKPEYPRTCTLQEKPAQ